jgi:hypothetical protein
LAIYLRTDTPVAPGTASLRTATGNSGTTSKTLTAYYLRVSIDINVEYTVLSTSISLTKRSLVNAVVFALITDNANIGHRLYIGGTLVQEVTGANQTWLVDLEGYRVLTPGSYTVEYRVYNYATPTPSLVSIDYNTGLSNNPAVKMVVYVVPLE